MGSFHLRADPCSGPPGPVRSEVFAAEAVSCLNKALCHLKDIWEQIGIPEDQRLQRTSVVKSHIKVRDPWRPLETPGDPLPEEGGLCRGSVSISRFLCGGGGGFWNITVISRTTEEGVDASKRGLFCC